MQLTHANIMVSEWIHWTQQEYSCCVKLSTQTGLQGKGCIWDDRGKAKAFYRPAFNKSSSTQIGKLSLSILEIKMNPFFAVPTKLKITYIFLFKYSCHGAWSQLLMWEFFNHKYFSSLQLWNGLEQEKEMTCSFKDRSSWEEWDNMPQLIGSCICSYLKLSLSIESGSRTATSPVSGAAISSEPSVHQGQQLHQGCFSPFSVCGPRRETPSGSLTWPWTRQSLEVSMPYPFLKARQVVETPRLLINKVIFYYSIR